MGSGTWSRWGRDSCVGYSLAIGDLLVGSVVKKEGRWEASIGTVPLETPEGTTKFEAMAIVERRIEARMSFALEEWAIFQAWKGRAQATPAAPERGNLEHKT